LSSAMLQNMTQSARAEFEAERDFEKGIQERRQIMDQLRETYKQADQILNSVSSGGNNNPQNNVNFQVSTAVPAVFTARPQTPILSVEKVVAAPNLNLSSVNLGFGTSLSGFHHASIIRRNVSSKKESNNSNISSSIVAGSNINNQQQENGSSLSAKGNQHRDANNSKAMAISIIDEKEQEEIRERMEAEEKEALRMAKFKNRRNPLGRPSSSSKLKSGEVSVKAPSPDLFFVPEKKPGAAGSGFMIRNIVPAAGVTAKLVDPNK
jgi:hypothetical protein